MLLNEVTNKSIYENLKTGKKKTHIGRLGRIKNQSKQVTHIEWITGTHFIDKYCDRHR